MNDTLRRIYSSLKEAQEAAQKRLTRQQFVAVLQGITGFASGIFTSIVSEEPQGPFAFINTALAIVEYDANKPCRTALRPLMKNVKKWLTFGKYRPLNDSSDLNFDKMNVSTVPDIMKVPLFGLIIDLGILTLISAIYNRKQ